MHVRIVRRWLTPKSTIGEIFVNGHREGYTLEDFRREPGEAKVPGKTCIPEGTYHAAVTHSPKFGRPLVLLWNVELADGRRLVVSPDGKNQWEGIRCHEGVHADHTEGCVVLGQQRGRDELRPASASRGVVDVVQAKLQGAQDAGEAITVTIELAAERDVC